MKVRHGGIKHKPYNALHVLLKFPLYKNVRLGLSWNDDRYLDKRQTQNKYFLYQGAATGIEFHSPQTGDLILLTGYRRENRFDIDDMGSYYALQYDGQWFKKSQSGMATFDGERSNFDSRYHKNINANLNHRINFGEAASIRNQIRLRDLHQSSYIDSQASLQTRDIYELQYLSHLDYAISSKLKWGYELAWSDVQSSQAIEKDALKTSQTENVHFDLTNSVFTTWVDDIQRVRLSFEIKDEQQKHFIDYSRNHYALKADYIFDTESWIDTVNISGALTRLKHDTPDTLNDDDRDELRIYSALAFGWKRHEWKYTMGGDINFFHLIYLFSSRSIDNRWNRQFRFWNEYQWKTRNFSGKSYGNVAANYYIYDFENDSSLASLDLISKSFVHRILQLRQTLQWDISSNFRWTFDSQFRGDENGRLDWMAFGQNQTQFKETIHIENRFYYKFQHINLYLGWINQRVLTFRFDDKPPQRWERYGPSLGASLRNKRIKFSIDDIRREVDNAGDITRSPFLKLSLSYYP